MELTHNLLPASVQQDLIHVGQAAQLVRKTKPFDEARYEQLMRTLDAVVARAKRMFPEYYLTPKEAYENRVRREAMHRKQANDSVFDQKKAA